MRCGQIQAIIGNLQSIKITNERKTIYMKKIKPEIKNEYTLKLQDEIDATEMIASVFFRNVTDENGNTSTIYTPYLEKLGQVNAIAKCFISGIEFDEDEDVYDSVMDDKDIRPLIDTFFVTYDEKSELSYHQKIFNDVMYKVYDLVSYRKSLNFANVQNEANSILTYKLLDLIDKEREKNEKEVEAMNNLNNWIAEQREQQEKLNSIVTPEMQKNFIENFDMNDMTEAIYKKISEGDLHKKNKEIVEANRKIREQENKIIEMQNAFAREQQKENVKNVLKNDGK